MFKKEEKVVISTKILEMYVKVYVRGRSMLRTVLLGTLVTQVAKVGMQGRAGLIGR